MNKHFPLAPCSKWRVRVNRLMACPRGLEGAEVAVELKVFGGEGL